MLLDQVINIKTINEKGVADTWTREVIQHLQMQLGRHHISPVNLSPTAWCRVPAREHVCSFFFKLQYSLHESKTYTSPLIKVPSIL